MLKEIMAMLKEKTPGANRIPPLHVLTKEWGVVERQKALKEKIKRFIEEGNTGAARELLEDSITKRPDLLLPGSDVSGELRALANRLLN